MSQRKTTWIKKNNSLDDKTQTRNCASPDSHVSFSNFRGRSKRVWTAEYEDAHSITSSICTKIGTNQLQTKTFRKSKSVSMYHFSLSIFRYSWEINTFKFCADRFCKFRRFLPILQFLLTEAVVSRSWRPSGNRFLAVFEKAFPELSFATKNFEIRSFLKENE